MHFKVLVVFCRFFARLNHDEILKPTVKRSRRSVPPKVIKLANEIVLREGPNALTDND